MLATGVRRALRAGRSTVSESVRETTSGGAGEWSPPTWDEVVRSTRHGSTGWPTG